MTEDILKPFNKKKTPSSWFFTPTLTYIGKKEAEQFGKKFLKKEFLKGKEYDLIICSPTVRTIMTALYALDAADMNGKVIHIIPHINEKYTTTKNLLERANAGIPVEIIDDVIQLIKDRVQTNITVNSTIYKKAKETNKESMEEFYNGNFSKAREIIENLENTHDNVIAFVHANFIRERIKETLFTLTDFPTNCSAYKINYSSIQPEYIGMLYGDNINIRNTIEYNIIEEETNFNSYNYWCSLKEGSLRGDINRLWIKCYVEHDHYNCGKNPISRRNLSLLNKIHSIKTGGKRKRKSNKNKRSEKNKRSKKNKRKRIN